VNVIRCLFLIEVQGYGDLELLKKIGLLEIETERQRDRETERQRDRETERQRDRETERTLVEY
jgi:hypothetical protein